MILSRLIIAHSSTYMEFAADHDMVPGPAKNKVEFALTQQNAYTVSNNKAYNASIIRHNLEGRAMDTPENIPVSSEGTSVMTQQNTSSSSSTKKQGSKSLMLRFATRIYHWFQKNTFAPQFLSGTWSHPIFGCFPSHVRHTRNFIDSFIEAKRHTDTEDTCKASRKKSS